MQSITPLQCRSFDDLTPFSKSGSNLHKGVTPQPQFNSQLIDGLDLSGLPSNHSSGKKVCR